MSNIINWLKDKAGNIIVPKTLTKAVQDENGVTLESTLNEMDTDIDTLNSNLTDRLGDAWVHSGMTTNLTVLSTGIYTINNFDDKITDAPWGGAFGILVSKVADYIYQLAFCENMGVALRDCEGGVWTDWKLSDNLINVGYGTLGDGVTCGSWSIFKNGNTLKVFMIFNLSRELAGDSVITKLNATTKCIQFATISSPTLPNAGVVSFNANGELKTAFGLSQGEYRIDTTFIVDV